MRRCDALWTSTAIITGKRWRSKCPAAPASSVCMHSASFFLVTCVVCQHMHVHVRVLLEVAGRTDQQCLYAFCFSRYLRVYCMYKYYAPMYMCMHAPFIFTHLRMCGILIDFLHLISYVSFFFAAQTSLDENTKSADPTRSLDRRGGQASDARSAGKYCHTLFTRQQSINIHMFFNYHTIT